MRRSIGALLAAACAIACVATPARADDDPWLGRDKLLHFGASGAIAATGYGVTAALYDVRAEHGGEGRGVAVVVGSGLALAAGAGKEALDAAGFGQPSWRDFAWDVLGTAVGVALAYGIDSLLRRDPRPAPAAQAALLRF